MDNKKTRMCLALLDSLRSDSQFKTPAPLEEIRTKLDGAEYASVKSFLADLLVSTPVNELRTMLANLPPKFTSLFSSQLDALPPSSAPELSSEGACYCLYLVLSNH